jgi:hypothetical protein
MFFYGTLDLIIPNNPLTRHSGPSSGSGQADLRSGRNPVVKTLCKADKTSCLRRVFWTNRDAVTLLREMEI